MRFARAIANAPDGFQWCQACDGWHHPLLHDPMWREDNAFLKMSTAASGSMMVLTNPDTRVYVKAPLEIVEDTIDELVGPLVGHSPLDCGGPFMCDICYDQQSYESEIKYADFIDEDAGEGKEEL